MTNLLTILLQAEAAPEGNPYQFLILLGGMFIIMYFFMLRPQMKRQKEAKKFRESLSKGDKVVTIGGVHGKIVEMNEKTVVISIEQGKMRVERSAISPNQTVSEQDMQQNS
ncbi:preprotein translocase subunit YajC [Sanyastnella coralliicola]|uniref:preprotein translocase subunit YajC n=1 Tax=Sanyastnella coralliicola TaxID=3069118 RepID=UPI0027B9026E|nr:preprotein translocase subunit YajC [Longitalea sp. SCSIO 12813]